MAFNKHFVRIRNRVRIGSAVREIAEHANKGASPYRLNFSCSRLLKRIALFGIAGYLFISVAPIFSAVAPPLRLKVPAAATSSASASDPISAVDRIAAMEQKLADAQSAGDNAWMLVSSGWCC